MSEAKLCVDCAYYIKGDGKVALDVVRDWRENFCLRVCMQKTDLVLGGPDMSFIKSCRLERSKTEGNKCGPNAIHFTPKKESP